MENKNEDLPEELFNLLKNLTGANTHKSAKDFVKRMNEKTLSELPFSSKKWIVRKKRTMFSLEKTIKGLERLPPHVMTEKIHDRIYDFLSEILKEVSENIDINNEKVDEENMEEAVNEAKDIIHKKNSGD